MVSAVIGSIILAAVVVITLALLFSWQGPWAGFWPRFLVLFLLGWASVVWLGQHGPLSWGLYWLPPLFIMLLFVIIVAATSGTAPAMAGRESVRTVPGVFFWIMIAMLVLAVIAGYKVNINDRLIYETQVTLQIGWQGAVTKPLSSVWHESCYFF